LTVENAVVVIGNGGSDSVIAVGAQHNDAALGVGLPLLVTWR